MSWLIKALSSSVGKKFVMGITGLLLCGFLVAHLAGNLLLFVPDSKSAEGDTVNAYNEYAHALHANEGLLIVAEIGLALLFATHIGLAIKITLENRAARSTNYATKESKLQQRTTLLSAETWMFISGAIVLLFLVVHLADFKFEVRDSANVSGDLGIDYGDDPFIKAKNILADPIVFVVYIIGSLVLALHVSHGFASAFQSLGLSHPKYDLWIKCLSWIFAFVIGLGFVLFPLWGLFPL